MRRAAHFARIALLLLIGLVPSGCGSRPPEPPPKNQPTAFFDWCVKEHFGVTSPQTKSFHHRATNIRSGKLGYAFHNAAIVKDNEEDVRASFHETVANLRKVARENGCELTGPETLARPDDHSLALTYRSGLVHGKLAAKYELQDSSESGKDVKRYFMELELTETYPAE
jgi:hypothetical protein